MTETKDIAPDFANWAEGFSALAKVVASRNTVWKRVFTNEDEETKQAEKLWDAAEADIKQHFFARYPDTQSFWREYLDSFEKEFPPRPGFEAETAKTKQHYLDLASESNRTADNCELLYLSSLYNNAQFQLEEILWSRGYTLSADDARNGRQHVSITRDYTPG